MSERLPYEEQLDQAWNELPLPDENMAWKDMKRRLDEDDDERIVIPPPKRGCGMGALLIGLLLLGGLWFLLRPEKWFQKKDPAISEQAQPDKAKDKTSDNRIEQTNSNSTATNTNTNNRVNSNDGDTSTSVPTNVTNDPSQPANNPTDNTKIEVKEPVVKNNAPGPGPLIIRQDPSVQKTPSRGSPIQKNPATRTVKTKKGNKDDQSKNDSSNKPITSEQPFPDQKKPSDVTKQPDDTVYQKKPDSLVTTPVEVKTGVPAPKDSAISVADNVTKKSADSITRNINPLRDEEKKPIFLSAGLGLHQQIPIAGQEWTTYSSLGRKGILTDYIPSVNFRMEKQDQWFLQSEFRYGAPQHTKQLTYTQTIAIDTFTQSIITNSSVLKKSFYHQLPLTFNYYILPGWSVGTGLQWNKFYSAVAEQEIKKRRPGTTNDSIISKGIVKVSNDSTSAFIKSWFQGVIQTQYQWKRFSIGARYSFGLQPYIKISLPNQPLQQEKNSSFQVFLRYELWRSRLRE